MTTQKHKPIIFIINTTVFKIKKGNPCMLLNLGKTEKGAKNKVEFLVLPKDAQRHVCVLMTGGEGKAAAYISHPI